MHLSIQFRHKATSTVSGEIETVSDCAEATHCLQQSDMLPMGWRCSIWWASCLHFWWKCWPVALIVGLNLSFLLQVFCFFFSLLSGLCLQIIWVVQVLMRRGHLLSSLLITLELWQREPRERTEPIRTSSLKINTFPEKKNTTSWYSSFIPRFIVN